MSLKSCILHILLNCAPSQHFQVTEEVFVYIFHPHITFFMSCLLSKRFGARVDCGTPAVHLSDRWIPRSKPWCAKFETPLFVLLFVGYPHWGNSPGICMYSTYSRGSTGSKAQKKGLDLTWHAILFLCAFSINLIIKVYKMRGLHCRKPCEK